MVNNVNRKDLVNAFQNSIQKLIGGTSSGFSLPALSLPLPLPPSESSLSFFLSMILLASSLDGGLRTIWLPFVRDSCRMSYEDFNKWVFPSPTDLDGMYA